MPDTLARTMLARAAKQINARSGFAALPSLIFLTDDLRTPDPLPAIAALPRGALVIVRARDPRHRRALVHDAARLSRQGGLLLSVAGDAALAAEIAAHGIHLAEAESARAAELRAVQPGLFITAAAHDAPGLERAQRAGADAALLSPIFPTASHADRPGLGIERLRSLAQGAALPLYALGGIDASNVAQLADIRLAGIAAIGALMP